MQKIANKRLHADAQTYAHFVGCAALTLPQKLSGLGAGEPVVRPLEYCEC